MRYLKLVLTTILLICVTATFIPVYAEQDIQSEADTLNALSILRGSGGNYNLDGQLLRSEATAFIIRLLGKENYVLQNKASYSTVKFPDVKATDWFTPYVGYCVEQGIMTGYVDGSFGPIDFISEKAFLKMVLCALGYIYSEDFTWGNVYQSAYNAGLVTDPIYMSKIEDNTQYKREQVVDVLYNALSKENQVTKGKQILVLINEGIITKELALSTGILQDSMATSVQIVTPIDKNRISIKINENVKALADEDIKIFESTDFIRGLNVVVESQLNGEIIVKTTDQLPDKAYTVELTNVTDMEGNISAKLLGTFTGYRSLELKSDFFKISKIEPVSKNVVNLYFTHPVNINSEIASSYGIYQGDILFEQGSAQSMIVKQLGGVNNGVSIFLKDKSFISGTEYTLRVSGDMSSAYGVKLNESAGDSIRFTGMDTENEALKLVNINVNNYKTIQLDFNMDINPVLAQQIFSYYLTDSLANPVAISKAVVSTDGDSKGKSVVLSISSVLEKTKNYNIMINNINDVTRQFSISEVNYSFSGYYPVNTDLKVINVSPIDAGTLAVYFDKPLDKTSAVIPSNYYIAGVTHSGYMAAPVKVYYDTVSNPYLIKLFLPSDKLLDGARTYKLRIMQSLQDYLGNGSTQMQEFGFNGNGSATAKPLISEAVIISSDAIKVTFNKEIAMDVPNLLNTNYTLENDDSGVKISRVPSSVTFYNASTLILKFDLLDFNVKYTLKFDSLKDYSGVNTRTVADGSNSIEVKLGE